MNIKLDNIFSLVFFVFMGIVLILELLWIIKTERRLKRFFIGKKAKDLEDTLFNLENDIVKLKSAKEKNEKEIILINEKLKESVRGIETIRFNPFPDQGSNQSFAIGMLNEKGNGVVISSLYSRERVSVFAKPIKNGDSEYELTNEEKKVLEKALVK